MATPKNHSVMKAFAILKAFHDPEEWLTSCELSRRANLPEASGYRLIQTLADIGAVVRGPRGRYRPGLLLLEFLILSCGLAASVITIEGVNDFLNVGKLQELNGLRLFPVMSIRLQSIEPAKELFLSPQFADSRWNNWSERASHAALAACS